MSAFDAELPSPRRRGLPVRTLGIGCAVVVLIFGALAWWGYRSFAPFFHAVRQAQRLIEEVQPHRAEVTAALEAFATAQQAQLRVDSEAPLAGQRLALAPVWPFPLDKEAPSRRLLVNFEPLQHDADATTVPSAVVLAVPPALEASFDVAFAMAEGEPPPIVAIAVEVEGKLEESIDVTGDTEEDGPKGFGVRASLLAVQRLPLDTATKPR